MNERWQDIERIYHQARELQGSARAEFLAKTCAGNAGLRDEVESLLAHEGQAGGFLETPPVEMAAKVFGEGERSPAASAAAVEPGAMIAHYRVTARLGAGGMGEVFRARDTKLQRDVALKILPQALARDAERMARFEREAQVLASLNHPNIAAIYGLEESNGIRALVMELVEGETLGQKIVGEGSALPREPKGLPYLDALPIAKQIAEALEYAHEHGIIHRDLKPANVKITPEGAVKVLDFGLAKVLSPQDSTAALDPANSPTLSMTATEKGMILGTAAYMSPEQAKGLKVDRRCDIWAFGCVLYEMLSGRKAFEGETISDILAAVLTKEPDWNALPSTTPPSIQKLVRRCMVKNSKQRLRDIGDARIAIEETLSGPTSLTSPLPQGEGGPGERDRVRVSPLHRALPWALAAACIMTGILVYWLAQHLPQTGVSSFFRRGAPQAAPKPEIHSLVVLPLENLSGNPEQEYFADGMTDELITELAKIGGLRVIATASAMRYHGTKTPLPEIARELNVDGVIVGSVLRSGNRVRINAQLVDPSTERILWTQTYNRDLGDILALHSDVARAVASEIRVTVTPEEQQRLASARPVNPQAYDAYLRGRYLWNKRTGQDMRKGIEYFERAVEIDPNYAPAYAGIADSYDLLAFFGPLPAATAYMKAREAASKAVALDDSLAESHASLAQVSFHYDWDWPLAEKEFRLAIALNPNYATAHHWYAGFLSLMGRHDEALAEIRRAQKLDPLSRIINTEVGSIRFYSGKYDLAINQLESTRELYPDFWYLRSWLGKAYLAKGAQQEGLQELESSVKLSGGNGSTLAELAYGYAVSGQHAKARRALSELENKAKESYVSPYNFAVVYTGLGDKDLAVKHLEKAFQEHYISMHYLNVDRHWLFRSLNSDPRFQSILRRMNFPQQSRVATD